MKKISLHSFIRFSLLGLIAWNLTACGDGCSIISRLFTEPQCSTLKLEANKTPLPLDAACVGSANSRKVRVNCTSNSGSYSQCTAISNGATVTAVLVPNNANGNFLDGNGTLYTTCGQLIVDLNSPSVKLQSVAGVFVSSPTGPNSLSCNSTGCNLNAATQCMSGWSADTSSASSTAANLPGGASNPYLSCVYFNNGSPPPMSVGAWNAPMPQLVITTNNLHFSSGWTDAFSITY